MGCLWDCCFFWLIVLLFCQIWNVLGQKCSLNIWLCDRSYAAFEYMGMNLCRFLIKYLFIYLFLGVYYCFCAKDVIFRFSGELGTMNIWLSEWNVTVFTYIFMYVFIIIEFELELMWAVDKMLHFFWWVVCYYVCINCWPDSGNKFIWKAI